MMDYERYKRRVRNRSDKNLSFAGTWEDEVSIVRTYSMQPFKDHYELYGYELLPGHHGTNLGFGNRHNKDLGKRAMYDYLDKLKQYLKDNKDKYSSVTLFVLSHGNEVSFNLSVELNVLERHQ